MGATLGFRLFIVVASLVAEPAERGEWEKKTGEEDDNKVGRKGSGIQ